MSADAPDVLALIEALEGVLSNDTRSLVVEGLARKGSAEDGLRRLRSAMGEHTFVAGSRKIELSRAVRRLDRRTAADGFRVLHAWNHQTHRFTDDVVPVLLLDFYARARPEGVDQEVVLAILLDAYFLHVLALCSTRVWDVPDPDRALERLGALLVALQGEDGSRHRFVGNAETLLIYALSQFHPEEQAYDRVIERVATLSVDHRNAFAGASAAVLSAHLRWGLWLMYGRDVVRMRADNEGDYPWLLESVRTLLSAWAASVSRGEPADARAHTSEALMLALAADPWAFTGKRPGVFGTHADRYDEVVALLREHHGGLLAELEAHRPGRHGYSPLALHFNFPHNALVAIVTLALLEGRPQRIPLNALLGGSPADVASGDDADNAREALARTLMAFSRATPDRLGHRGAMLIAYDPLSAMRSYAMTVDTLRDAYG